MFPIILSVCLNSRLKWTRIIFSVFMYPTSPSSFFPIRHESSLYTLYGNYINLCTQTIARKQISSESFMLAYIHAYSMSNGDGNPPLCTRIFLAVILSRIWARRTRYVWMGARAQLPRKYKAVSPHVVPWGYLFTLLSLWIVFLFQCRFEPSWVISASGCFPRVAAPKAFLNRFPNILGEGGGKLQCTCSHLETSW